MGVVGVRRTKAIPQTEGASEEGKETRNMGNRSNFASEQHTNLPALVKSQFADTNVNDLILGEGCVS